MQKGYRRIEAPRERDSKAEPLAEGRMFEPRRIIAFHCMSITAHMRDEKENLPNAIMLGGYTQYGVWWFGQRDPKKRPFYTYGPDVVESAIRKLSETEVREMADQLSYIARMSVTEFRPASMAAKERLSQIGMQVG